MDENKPDILNEIFERAQESTPPPQRPKFEYPSEDDPLPSSLFDGKREESEAPDVKIPLWLSIGLGAVLLILIVCVAQLARVGGRLAFLEDTINEELGGMEQLRKENEELQATRDRLQTQAQRAEDNAEMWQERAQMLDITISGKTVQVLTLNNFWYVHQLMEAGDYTMAAFAAWNAHLRYSSITGDIYFSLPIVEQFEQDCQTLIEQGYLSERSNGYLRVDLPENLQDEKTKEALTALWDVLDSYYCTAYNYFETVSSYGDVPIRYFDAYGGTEFTFIKENCGTYTLQLYRQMIDGMVEIGQLQWEDGRLAQGPRHSSLDVIYGFPEYDPTR